MQNKRPITDEEMEQLQPYEQHLHSALYADYVVGLGTVASTTLFDIYNRLFPDYQTNRSCGWCVIHVCKGLAKLYYARRDEQMQAEAQAAKKKSKKKKEA